MHSWISNTDVFCRLRKSSICIKLLQMPNWGGSSLLQGFELLYMGGKTVLKSSPIREEKKKSIIVILQLWNWKRWKVSVKFFRVSWILLFTGTALEKTWKYKLAILFHRRTHEKLVHYCVHTNTAVGICRLLLSVEKSICIGISEQLR